jgi:nanoRNase/pAp phosphatase (c-di-AMP/oligoRNAs hydrolase)
MACVTKDLGLWRAIYHDEHKLEDILVAGVGVMKYSDMQIQHIAKNAVYSTLANEPVIMVNSATLMSELGDYLLHKPENIDKVKFAVIWCQRGDSITFSLRSSNKTDNNCAALCQKFGGGGHKHAAGFNVSLADGLTLGKLQFNLS